jgi:acetyltransferase
VVNPDGESVEFALAVGDDWQKCGVGRKLMTALIECARMKGYRAVVGDVLSTNAKMFRLMTSLGFTIHPHPDDTAVKRVVKPLTGWRMIPGPCGLAKQKAGQFDRLF